MAFTVITIHNNERRKKEESLNRKPKNLQVPRTERQETREGGGRRLSSLSPSLLSFLSSFSLCEEGAAGLQAGRQAQHSTYTRDGTGLLAWRVRLAMECALTRSRPLAPPMQEKGEGEGQAASGLVWLPPPPLSLSAFWKLAWLPLPSYPTLTRVVRAGCDVSWSGGRGRTEGGRGRLA